jgi:hypothetical protein
VKRSKRQETDLFLPIKAYLEAQGYQVYSEVRGADLLAKKGSEKEEEWIAIEMKTKMSLKLLNQGVARQESFDSVYLALPLEGSQAQIPGYKELRKTLVRLGLGMIVARFLRRGSRVEILLHPGEEKRRSRPSKRQGMIREIDGRYAELNQAGEASVVEKFTAYKQQCLLIAWALEKAGPQGISPKDLRRLDLPERCGALLGQNIYGWFDRIRRGTYTISEAGKIALQRNQKIVQRIIHEFLEHSRDC